MTRLTAERRDEILQSSGLECTYEELYEEIKKTVLGIHGEIYDTIDLYLQESFPEDVQEAVSEIMAKIYEEQEDAVNEQLHVFKQTSFADAFNVLPVASLAETEQERLSEVVAVQGYEKKFQELKKKRDLVAKEEARLAKTKQEQEERQKFIGRAWQELVRTQEAAKNLPDDSPELDTLIENVAQLVAQIKAKSGPQYLSEGPQAEGNGEQSCSPGTPSPSSP